ncbi:glycosyltransferase [Aciduricibacillus chroicocephali]|uniref:Glycosyltransferase n=1 Tax=Aciduricibacillus chroicocephali TaxID=3054939 RepID=A0ABY9KU24_9BACI|nr:glycosyltransferase [Bacillaceae bacterium 44XB]
MRKRILFISDHGDPLQTLGGKQAGGQNNYVRQLALALSDMNYAVDVVTHWSDPKTKRVEYFGKVNRVIRIEAGYKGFVSKNDMYGMLPRFYDEIANTLDLNAYDAIHSHYWLSGLLGLKIAEKYNLPLIHTSHSLGIAKAHATGKRDERRLAAERHILRNADQIIATTKSEKELIEQFAKGHAPVHVISIGVDKVFEPELSKASSGQEPLFVYAGRLEETKGIHTLLKAFSILKKKNPGNRAKLILAGGEASQVDLENGLPTVPALKEAVTGIEEDVRFIGPQPPEVLATLFNKALATVVPSFYESFGMVAAEAQSCGSPVIASKVGGLANIVVDGETGLLTMPRDADDLALAMEAFLDNQLLARRMGRNAAIYAKKHFRWKSITEQIAALYEEGSNHAEHITLFGN